MPRAYSLGKKNLKEGRYAKSEGLFLWWELTLTCSNYATLVNHLYKSDVSMAELPSLTNKEVLEEQNNCNPTETNVLCSLHWENFRHKI